MIICRYEDRYVDCFWSFLCCFRKGLCRFFSKSYDLIKVDSVSSIRHDLLFVEKGFKSKALRKLLATARL